MRKSMLKKLLAVVLLITLGITSVTPIRTFAVDQDSEEEAVEEIAEELTDTEEEDPEEETEQPEEEVVVSDNVVEDVIENVTKEAAEIGSEENMDEFSTEDKDSTEYVLEKDLTIEEPYIITEDNAVYSFKADDNATLYQGQAGKPHIIIDGAKGVVVTFDHVTLDGNGNAGGIELINGAQAVVRDATIRNSTGDNGGAFKAEGTDTKLTVSGGTINENTAVKGGGIYIAGGASLVTEGGVTIKNNEALTPKIGSSSYGGGIYLGDGVTARISNISFTGNEAQSTYKTASSGSLGYGGALAIVNASDITFGDNVKIGSDSKEQSNKAIRGAGIYYADNKGIETDTPLSIGAGVSITNNEAGNTRLASNSYTCAGGLYIDKNTAVTLNGAVITGNTSKAEAGGVLVQENSLLVMNNGKIDNNESARSGGGLKVEAEGRFVMENGTINYNTCQYNGGGIHGANTPAYHNPERSSIILNGGEVSYNESKGTSRTSAGIYGYYVEINGASVDHNALQVGYAAAINASTVVMTEGSVSNNFVHKVTDSWYEYSVGTTISTDKFYMSGGTIDGNDYGEKTGDVDEYYISGTVWVGDDEEDLEVEITGGTFSNNRSEAGGALYVNHTDVKISGDTKFIGNKAITGGAIFVEDLDILKTDAAVSFENNTADSAWVMTDTDDIAMHGRNIKTNKFSSSLPYGYNNFDINYTKGEKVESKTVTYHLNYLDDEEENMYLKQNILFGKAVRPENPEREGYEFKGWAEEKTSDVYWNFDNNVAADMTLYAQWESLTYTVTFDANGGQIVHDEPSVTVVYGASITEADTPQVTRGGFQFTGWYTNTACTAAYVFGSEIKADMTLYAGWEELPQPEQYTVTFDTNGLTDTEVGGQYGSSFADGNTEKNIEIMEGAALTAPDGELKQLGYKFVGWYTEDGNQTEHSDSRGSYYRYSESEESWGKKWNFSDPVEGSMTLYAKWEPSVYQVEVLDQLVTALSSMRDEVNIELLNDLELTSNIKALRYKKTTVSNIRSSDGKVRHITQKGDGYHFALFTAGTDYTLSFDNVVLDSESGYGGIDLKGYSTFRLHGHENSVITGITKRSYGGAIEADEEATVYIDGMILEGNSLTGTGRGGAIYAGGETHLIVKDTIIRDNHATYGGGIYVVEDLSYLAMDNVIFEGNEAELKGGGLFINGANIVNAVDEDGLGKIEFRQNEASYYVNVLSEEARSAFEEFAPKSKTYTVYDENEVFEIAYNNYDVNYGGEVYNVTYDANGAKGSVPVDKNYYGENSQVIVASGKLSMEGYQLAGWSKEPAAEKVTYKTGDSFRIEEDTVLYAVWKESVDGGDNNGGDNNGGDNNNGGNNNGGDNNNSGDNGEGKGTDNKNNGGASVKGNNTNKTGNAPKTGDINAIMIYIIAIALSLVLAVIFVKSRKKKQTQ